jgi:lysophospholipid acyltransferase (LPLAT)-like uncharacterized protein
VSAADRRVVWLARAGALVIRLLAGTWRLRWVDAHHRDGEVSAGRRVIYTLWHGQLLPLLWAHRGRRISIMISEHRDGELIARVAQSLGYRVVRGSTTRGAARALLGATRDIEAGFDMAITPDGPRGPAHSVAPGAAVIANRSGASLLPVAAHASRAWRLRSWDAFMIPKPFARVVVAYAPPLPPREEAARDAAADESRVRDAIDAAERRARAP